MERVSYVYILSSGKNGTLYIGVTNSLVRRVFEHRQKRTDGFCKKYNVTQLVYFEVASDITDAITREKQLKGYLRAKKIDLIERDNPGWTDLWDGITSTF